MTTNIRITTAGIGGECQICGRIDHDAPLAMILKRVSGPAGYLTETYVGECCQPRLLQEYREQAEQGEIEFIDARVTGPCLA